MVTQIWYFRFNVDVTTVIHFLPHSKQTTKRILYVITPKMTENLQLLQNTIVNF